MPGTVKVSKVQLGSSATATQNFTLETPIPEDGTCTLKRGDGTTVLSVDAASQVTFPQNTAQTVQNVAASRVCGTTYTNSTGKQITVMVQISSTAALSAVAVNINGITLYGTTQPSAGYGSGITFVVPNGNTYSVSTSAGTPTITSWLELR